MRSIVCLLIVWQVGVPATTAGENTRVLFLGNSYTYYQDLPSLVGRLLDSASDDMKISHRMIAPGGCTLEVHASTPKTVAAIEEHNWDFVVMQEQSMRPVVSPEDMLSAAKELQQAVNKSGAQSILFMTWARKHNPQMIDALARAYEQTAEALGAEVAPVGLAWALARKRHPKLNLHHSDGSHPAPAGTYLAACVIAGTLSGISPKEFTAPPPKGVSAADAKRLREVAALTLEQRAQVH